MFLGLHFQVKKCSLHIRGFVFIGGINTSKTKDNLIFLFKHAKNDNALASEQIYLRFKKKIISLSRKANYEEAETDITTFLIEFIKKIKIEKLNEMSEGKLVNYTIKSLENYKNNLIKNRHEIITKEITEENIKVYDDLENLEFISKYIESIKLSNIQKKILINLYVYNYKVSEIAKEFNVSRQAVNKNKLKALDIIKKEILNKGDDYN